MSIMEQSLPDMVGELPRRPANAMRVPCHVLAFFLFHLYSELILLLLQGTGREADDARIFDLNTHNACGCQAVPITAHAAW